MLGPELGRSNTTASQLAQMSVHTHHVISPLEGLELGGVPLPWATAWRPTPKAALSRAFGA
jgi:hypothetical protein